MYNYLKLISLWLKSGVLAPPGGHTADQHLYFVLRSRIQKSLYPNTGGPQWMLLTTEAEALVESNAWRSAER